MFKFLLKRKTGLGNSGIFFILSLLSVFLCIFLSKNEQEHPFKLRSN